MHSGSWLGPIGLAAWFLLLDWEQVLFNDDTYSITGSATQKNRRTAFGSALIDRLIVCYLPSDGKARLEAAQVGKVQSRSSLSATFDASSRGYRNHQGWNHAS